MKTNKKIGLALTLLGGILFMVGWEDDIGFIVLIGLMCLIISYDLVVKD